MAAKILDRANEKTVTACFNRVFQPVHDSRMRYVLLMGGAGSGKSTDTAMWYILRLLNDGRRNLMCIRKSKRANWDSTYSELEAAARRMDLADYFIFSKSPMTITCINGAKIIFRGVYDLNSRESLKSITFPHGKLTDIWIEETTEISKEDFDIIDDRLRGELDENLFYQIKMTFNPISTNSWIKKLFFDSHRDNALCHHSTYLDNRFIDRDYHKRMVFRKDTDPDGYRVYGLGQWGETQGLILPHYQVDAFDRNLSNFDQLAYGQDFGFNHANALILTGFRDGTIYICDELYVRGMDTGEIIRLAMDKGYRRDIIMYCDSAEPDRIRMWQKAGFRAVPVKKEPGSVLAQIDFLKGRQLYIHPSCQNIIREISSWQWQNDGAGGFFDAPGEGPDDAMAALRYAVEGIRRDKKGSVADIKNSGIW